MEAARVAPVQRKSVFLKGNGELFIYKGFVVAVGGFTSSVEHTCETMLKEPEASTLSVSRIVSTKSALRAIVTRNWRGELEDRSVIQICDLEEEENQNGDLEVGIGSGFDSNTRE